MIDKELLAKYLDPFAPGMSNHLFPIKYEALTPDLSCLLFKTVGQNKQDHYFVLVIFDYLKDLAAARDLIHEWHGKIFDLLTPAGTQKADEPDLQNVNYAYDKTYKGLLARVERPRGHGYWATNIVVYPGDDIDQKLAHLEKEQQVALKKGLEDLNRPESTISIYLAPDGRIEYFFW